MGLAFVAATYAEHWSTDKSVIDCVATLNVAEGDLLVAVVGFTTTARTITSIAETGGGNALSVGTLTNRNAVYGAMAYKIAAAANASATFRLTLSGNTTQPSMTIMQWRPDAGETVTVINSANTGGNGALAQTDNFNTDGADQLVVGGLSSHYQSAPTGKQIADLDADGSAWAATQYDTHGWWKTFATTQTGIHAQISIGFSDWVAMALAFKSEASGFTGTGAISQDEQAVSASGTLEFTGTSGIAQPDQAVDADGTVAAAVTGTSDISQAEQSVSASGVTDVVPEPARPKIIGGGAKSKLWVTIPDGPKRKNKSHKAPESVVTPDPDRPYREFLSKVASVKPAPLVAPVDLRPSVEAWSATVRQAREVSREAAREAEASAREADARAREAEAVALEDARKAKARRDEEEVLFLIS